MNAPDSHSNKQTAAGSQGDGPPGLRATSHVVELEPHQRLNQGCSPGVGQDCAQLSKSSIQSPYRSCHLSGAPQACSIRGSDCTAVASRSWGQCSSQDGGGIKGLLKVLGQAVQVIVRLIQPATHTATSVSPCHTQHRDPIAGSKLVYSSLSHSTKAMRSFSLQGPSLSARAAPLVAAPECCGGALGGCVLPGIAPVALPWPWLKAGILIHEHGVRVV